VQEKKCTKPKNRESERERGDSFPIVEANGEEDGDYFFPIVLQS